MFESRRSRMVGKLEAAERRRVAASSAGVLMSKSLQLSGDVYGAMLSRGFHGEVFLLDDFRTSTLDWLMLAVFGVLAIGGLYFGR
jgi:energy-coupling factor transporter transmembrane protein EcfT